MKQLFFTVLFCSFFSATVFSQISLSVDPTTPLDYFVYEASTPEIKSGYNARNHYLMPINFELSKVTQTKYSDLALYDTYTEVIDFIAYMEIKTTVNRTSNFVAYLIEARESETDPFVLFAKDTFFLSGTQITHVSETVYDPSETSYATFNVVYHANSKIDEIVYVTSSGTEIDFGGLKVVYNANNTIKTDTIYKLGYDGLGNKNQVEVGEYFDYYYNPGNLNKADSAYYYNVTYVPAQNERLYFTSNASDEITEIQFHVHNSGAYDYEYRFVFGEEVLSMIHPFGNVNEITLFPNPAIDRVFIKEAESGSHWYIYNSEGSLEGEGVYDENQGVYVTNMAKGIYTLLLEKGGRHWVGKFLR